MAFSALQAIELANQNVVPQHNVTHTSHPHPLNGAMLEHRFRTESEESSAIY